MSRNAAVDALAGILSHIDFENVGSPDAAEMVFNELAEDGYVIVLRSEVEAVCRMATEVEAAMLGLKAKVLGEAAVKP